MSVLTIALLSNMNFCLFAIGSKVAVIGGGISGLAAGRRLQSLGVDTISFNVYLFSFVFMN